MSDRQQLQICCCLDYGSDFLKERKNTVNPKYWDREAWANSVDPVQTVQNAV